MPPKKAKAGAKGKSKAKVPQAEPASNGAAEAVQEENAAPSEEAAKPEEPKPEEPKPEETKPEETKPEEPATEDAPAAEDKPADGAQPNAETDGTTREKTEPLDEVVPVLEPERAATKGKKRKADNAPAVEEEKPVEPAAEPAKEDATTETKDEDKPAKPSKKRKADAAPRDVREGSRRSGRGNQKSQPSTEQLLNYLLSNESADLCRPEDEVKALADNPELRTFSSSTFTPFEELVCAVILSRPISHRLGMRAIRTLLNDPYNFTTPKAIISAGQEKRHQALVEARTQHKDKTAEQLGTLADSVVSKFGNGDEDTSLEKLRDQGYKGWDMERDLLQQNIKGIGRTGLDIFFRRVQWLWPEAYPFVDERSSRGIEKLGLPKNPDELAKTLDIYWAKLDTSAIDQKDKDKKKRRAFVILCERATGAELEGKSEELLEAAASA